MIYLKNSNSYRDRRSVRLHDEKLQRVGRACAILAVAFFTAAFGWLETSSDLQFAQNSAQPPNRPSRRNNFPQNDSPQNARGNTLLTNRVSITIEGNSRVIRANGIPDHEMGAFPNSHNPNRVSEQNYNYRVPLRPQVAGKPTVLRMQPFGIAVNGIVFDPFAAEWWDNDPDSGWQFEPLGGAIDLGVDQSNAHVQPNGAYHYHAIPTGLLKKRGGGVKNKMTLLGWAADGFPIYGPWCYSDAKNTNSPLKKMKSGFRIKTGERPGGPGGKFDGSFVADYQWAKGVGDLDDCNSRWGVTPEFPQGTYYYVLTETFPFIPRQFKGTPDQSFARRGPPGGGRRGPLGFRPQTRFNSDGPQFDRRRDRPPRDEQNADFSNQPNSNKPPSEQRRDEPPN